MNRFRKDSYNMYMSDKLHNSGEKYLQKYLLSLTPLERAAHAASTTAWLMANLVLINELQLVIEEVDALRNSTDLEERALLPIAELGLTETLALLPTCGDA